MFRSTKFFFSIVAALFLSACSQNPHCIFDNPLMSPKVYSGCELGLIPVDNWAMLEKDGDSWGRYYRKDGQIFWKAKVDQKLQNIDVPTFVVNGKFVNFAQDKDRYYFFGEPLPVDYGTFKILSNTHSKDKNSVYYGVHKIEAADPQTFEVMSYTIYGQTPYGKDQNNVYRQWMKIEGADPKTFQVLDSAGHSKDKSWYYLYEKREKPVQ